MTIDTEPFLKSQSSLASGCDDSAMLLTHSVHSFADDMYTARSSTMCLDTHVGSLSLFSCCANLVLSVLGAAQLTLPYAMNQVGIAGGLLFLVLFTVLSMMSLRTLSTYELHFTPGPTDCLESYSELVVRVLGKAGAHMCTALVAVYAWGGSVSFMVILKSEFGWLAAVLGFPGLSGSVLLAVVVVAIVWPLSSAEDVCALKRISPLGCFAAMFITLVTVLSVVGMPLNFPAPSSETACSGPAGADGFSGELRFWPRSFRAAAAALPLLAFVLNSSWAYIPVLTSLRDKTDSRVQRLILSSSTVILASYFLLSFGGYWMFCDRVEPNILDSLGGETVPHTVLCNLVACARLAVTVQLTFALPMRFFVARQALAPDLRRLPRCALAGSLVISAALLALSPVSLATVLGVTSSAGASFIIYILPATVDLSLRLSSTRDLIGSGVSLALGVFIFLTGTWANLSGVPVGS